MHKSAHPFLTDTSALRFLVIDEADRMSEKGHYQELMMMLDRLSPLWGAAHQAIMSVDPNAVDPDKLEEQLGKGLGDKGGTGKGRKRGGAAGGSQVQRMLFSATLTLPAEWKKKVANVKGGYGGKAPEVRRSLKERRWGIIIMVGGMVQLWGIIYNIFLHIYIYVYICMYIYTHGLFALVSRSRRLWSGSGRRALRPRRSWT